MGRALDQTSERGRKPTSKYKVAARLRAILEAG
jgi:hypothetical protein